MQGCSYKEENNGCFAPFNYFCKFICKEAKRRNDPSFTQQNKYVKSERPNLNTLYPAKSIAVHKMNIYTPNKDINKSCLLHNKPHPFKKCRTFRNKLLDERKAFLKEKGICFKCCSSDTHLARNCKFTVKCTECDSTSHDTIMHPGPPPQTNKAPPLAEEDGGEGENQPNNVQVTSNCTEVCGPSQWGCSCSKICLTRLYPKGQKDSAVEAYAITDDQSNRSLTRPEFSELFDIKIEPFCYNLRTYSGLVETWGKMAAGFSDSVSRRVSNPITPTDWMSRHS